jgi:DNA-directed RNA polymerases I, II, and III subunit RPABC2
MAQIPRENTYYNTNSDDEDDNDSDGDDSVKKDDDGVEDEDEEDEFVESDIEMDDDETEDIDENITTKNAINIEIDDDEIYDDDDDDELNENYLQKLDGDVKQNIIAEYHPELNAHSMEEVEASCTIIRDEKGVIVDALHRTIPFVTRYEKARVIGERAKQINSGAKPFIEIEPSMIDGYLIALKEFEQKKIPFIIRRPFPNGTSEYWRLSDLEIIA